MGYEFCDKISIQKTVLQKGEMAPTREILHVKLDRVLKNDKKR